MGSAAGHCQSDRKQPLSETQSTDYSWAFERRRNARENAPAKEI